MKVKMAWRCCKAHTCDDEGAHCTCDMTLSHVIKVEKDQDMTWLDGPVASVKGKLSDDLAPMDRSNGEEQVRSRSMNQ